MLQGKKLADVVAEVLDEKAAAELAAERAKVKQVVERVTGDLKHEQMVLANHEDWVKADKERIAKLQKRLKLLKAGDQGALKEPPAETVGVFRHMLHPDPMRDDFLRRCRQEFGSLPRDMVQADLLLRRYT